MVTYCKALPSVKTSYRYSEFLETQDLAQKRCLSSKSKGSTFHDCQIFLGNAPNDDALDFDEDEGARLTSSAASGI